MVQTKSLDTALSLPLHGEFRTLLCVVEKMRIDQLLIRKAGPAAVPEEKRDFSHPQADRFAGANREEKIGLLRSK